MSKRKPAPVAVSAVGEAKLVLTPWVADRTDVAKRGTDDVDVMRLIVLPGTARVMALLVSRCDHDGRGWSWTNFVMVGDSHPGEQRCYEKREYAMMQADLHIQQNGGELVQFLPQPLRGADVVIEPQRIWSEKIERMYEEQRAVEFVQAISEAAKETGGRGMFSESLEEAAFGCELHEIAPRQYEVRVVKDRRGTTPRTISLQEFSQLGHLNAERHPDERVWIRVVPLSTSERAIH